MPSQRVSDSRADVFEKADDSIVPVNPSSNTTVFKLLQLVKQLLPTIVTEAFIVTDVIPLL